MIADSAVFMIDGHEVRIDRADDGTVAAHVSWPADDRMVAFTSGDWRSFAARVQAAIDSATTVIAETS